MKLSKNVSPTNLELYASFLGRIGRILQAFLRLKVLMFQSLFQFRQDLSLVVLAHETE